MEPQIPPFDINYTEGLNTGYKWFESQSKTPLFPFGFGLSYTTFRYSQLKVATPTVASTSDNLRVSFSLRNSGKLAGAEVAQVYVALPPDAGEPPKHLAAWSKVELAPGESKAVVVEIEPLLLSIFDTDTDSWRLLPGEYQDIRRHIFGRHTASGKCLHLSQSLSRRSKENSCRPKLYLSFHV